MIYKKKRNNRIVFLTCLMSLFLLCGCGQQEEPKKPVEESKPSSVYVAATPDTYDSADTACLVGKDEEKNTLTFYNFEVKKTYTLSFDGTSRFSDKYGTSVALSQMRIGELVDVTFMKRSKHLTTMSKAKSGWTFESLEDYTWDRVKGDITIGKDVYQVSPQVQCFSEGIRVAEDEISATDVVTLYGIDTTVLGILVERGHGFLRLQNDEYFIDGWIEVGNKLIQKITAGMCITVPEGISKVLVSNNGNSGVKEVLINRNQETILDVGDIEIAQPKSGKVLFSLIPEETKLYVDGSAVDTSAAVDMEYGLHQLIAKADGYETITKYIRVGQESAGVEIVMEKENDKSQEKEPAQSEEEVTSYYKVYVDAPASVEVYLDNTFVGISPCSFEKKAGSHMITLRKSGYTTKTMTVTFSDDDRDLSYSFADLVPVSEGGLNSTEMIEQLWDNILTE